MKKTITIFLLVCALLSKAQDIHFSQIFFSPQNLNPSEIGVFNGDLRVNAIQRNQWRAIPVPYRTFSISSDAKNLKKIKYFNPALIINYDRSGDSRYTQTQVMAGCGKLFKLDKDSVFFISLGVQAGFFSNSFQTNQLTFDNQYDGSSYNSSLSSGENFQQTKLSRPDANLGALFSYRRSSRSQWFSGFSLQHLINNNASFVENTGVKTNLKVIAYIRGEHSFKSNYFVLPYLGFIQREKNKEFQLGTSLGVNLSSSQGNLVKPYLGGFYRNKDSFFLQFGTFYNQFNVSVSYDVNTSGLVAATNNRGAVEFIFVYIFKKPAPFIIPKKFCPVFL